MKIEVIEHEKIIIGKTRNLERKQIDFQDAKHLRSIEEIRNQSIFQWGRNYLTPKQWVGVISIPNLNIEILPKITEGSSGDTIYQTLIYMIEKCNDLVHSKEVESTVSIGRHGFLEALITLFVKELEKQIGSGPIKEYKKITRNLSALKGNIDFQKHFNKNLFIESKFFCRYSSLVVDNKINRVIKFVLKKIAHISINPKNKNKIMGLLDFFYNVLDVQSTERDIDNIVLNRLTYRYETVLKYCRVFLEGLAVQLKTGDYTLSIMLFDMNKLFETFVYKSYKRVLGNISFQNTSHHLLHSLNTHKKRVLLRPDLLMVLGDEQGQIVIDTKWKIVEGFSDEKDIYQINAYLSAIPALHEGILLYPKTQKNDRMVGDYRILPPNSDKILKIRTIDLRLSRNSSLFKEHLLELLR